MEPGTPALQADSSPAEPQEKPKNTGAGSLNPSPVDFPNPGIELVSLALQAIVYQLSYQESPIPAMSF